MCRTSLNKIAVCIALMIITSGISRSQDSPPTVKRPSSKQQDWPVYGGTPENSRYSSLAQINRENVKQLQVAWSFDSGETGGLQTSPIMRHGVLPVATPSQKAAALNAPK